MTAPRRPLEDILADSRRSISKLDELLAELSATIDSLIDETEAQKQRSFKRRLW